MLSFPRAENHMAIPRPSCLALLCLLAFALKKLMQLAAKFKCLTGDGVRPEQRKCGFTLFNGSGKEADNEIIQLGPLHTDSG